MRFFLSLKYSQQRPYYRLKFLDRKDFFLYIRILLIYYPLFFMWLIPIVDLLFQIYMLMLFGRIISSWAPQLMQYRFMQFIAFYTDPYLNLFRKIIPPFGMVDISPILAFFSLSLLKDLIIFLIR
ncbi:Uncharacterized protein NEOC65_000554 [Neochlamydia sp. AcF65]|nr:Uncharacterized protein [Neochlamydia sp. AcF65]